MFLKKATTVFREMGALNGLLYGIALALTKVSNGHVRLVRYELVAQPISPRDTPFLRPSKTSQIRFVEDGDPLIAQFPRPAEVIACRFLDGQRCLAITSGERFAGYLWITRNAYEEDEVRCRFELAEPQIATWDSDVYVAPDFRHGRTFARLWSAANDHLSSSGVLWTFSRISAFNPHSLRSHTRLGTGHLCSATFLCFGPLQIMLASVSPFFHISCSARFRPTLRLSPP